MGWTREEIHLMCDCIVASNLRVAGSGKDSLERDFPDFFFVPSIRVHFSVSRRF